MTAVRVDRHDLRCPHCGSNRMPKDGCSRGKQTYKCGDCHYRHTLESSRHYYAAAIKERTIAMYLEAAVYRPLVGC